MSANIVRSTSAGGRITRQDLWNLLEKSQLANVDISALSADAAGRVVLVGSNPPTAMADGQAWWDQTDQLMRVFDSDLSYAFAVGPDRFESPAICGLPIATGLGVLLDGIATYSMYGNAPGIPVVRPVPPPAPNWIHCYGIASASGGTGAVIPITLQGLVPAYFAQSPWGQMPAVGTFVAGASNATSPGMVGAISTLASCVTSTPLVGILFERTVDASSAHSMCLYVKFTGPFRVRDNPL